MHSYHIYKVSHAFGLLMLRPLDIIVWLILWFVSASMKNTWKKNHCFTWMLFLRNQKQLFKKNVYLLENWKSSQQYLAGKPWSDYKLCSTSRLLIFVWWQRNHLENIPSNLKRDDFCWDFKGMLIEIVLYQFRFTENEKEANFKVDSKLLFYISPVS